MYKYKLGWKYFQLKEAEQQSKVRSPYAFISNGKTYVF